MSLSGSLTFSGSNAKIVVQGTLILEKNSSMNAFNVERTGAGRVMDRSGKYAQVVINQFNSAGENVEEKVHQWQFSKWNELTPGLPSTFPLGPVILRSWQTVIGNDKYQNWQENLEDVTNHKSLEIKSSTSAISAYLKNVYNATIKNSLEGYTSFSAGKVGFKDPWLIDNSDNMGPKNRGTVATALMYDNFNSPFTPNVNTNYKGVFLNREPIFNGKIVASYKVRVPQYQDIGLTQTGRTHRFYFMNWSATNGTISDPNTLSNGYYETPVVFTGADAVVQANLKGTQLSNNSSALSNNGQQKIARTYYGDLYMVYESMNHVWLEKSTDGGSTWQVWNEGKPLDSGEGKCPSIDSNGDILIVWQEKNGLVSDIKIACINPQNTNQVKISSLTPIGGLAFESPAYADNANPVIAFNPRNTFFVAWEKQPYLFGSPSLAYCYGRLNTYNWQYTIEKFQTGFVSTSSSATNPSVSVTKALSYYRQHFCIAWEENNQLKFRKYAQDSLNYNSITTFGNTYTVSSGSGFPVNVKPSVFAVSDTSARIVWNGIYDDGVDHFSVAIFKATDNNQFWNFGDNVNNVSLNGSSTRYAVAWAKTNSTIEYTDNTTLSNITTLSNASNFSGKYIQISNGTNPVDFRALTLNTPSNPPNYFQTKQIYSVNKENVSSISSGRGGCVYTDDYQFYFSIGDVSVNGNAVKFVDLADSVSIKSANTLNKYLVTEPFEINDNAKFEYSALFGVIDSAAAFKALKTGDAVKYKVELIDDKTGSVISSFDNLTFSKDKITKRGYKTYSISAKGLGNKTVRLRLVTESNINADYAINNIYAAGSVLKKSAAEELEIKNAPVVKEYALEQNYPNPFNPSTVINYQIPSANKVSLKVYDVLGKEIATLVDGFKEAGRYQVTFDCGKLASGVYIYKLESGKFVQSRKMILTK